MTLVKLNLKYNVRKTCNPWLLSLGFVKYSSFSIAHAVFFLFDKEMELNILQNASGQLTILSEVCSCSF